MSEKPREYKKRIDDTRAKRRINRDKLLEYLQEYELVDGKYKSETKQKILVNFDKNEKSEKSDELYVKIGKELGNIEKKYKELEDVKNKLNLKRQEYLNLKKQLVEQDIDGSDETTLKLEEQKLIKLKEKLKTTEEEIKNFEEEVVNRERELKEIEETYGTKEDTEESLQENNEQQEEKQQEEQEIKENPEILEEYKEKILSERGRIDEIKRNIIDLLDEGIGIDDKMKDRIKSKISETFNKYETKQEWSLRMKSARYMEDRKGIFDGFKSGDERESKTIGGKQLIKGEKLDGKRYIIRGGQELFDDFDLMGDIKEIGGKVCFIVKKDGKRYVKWGKEQYNNCYDYVGDPINIGGKPCFIAEKDGKYCVMRGKVEIGGRFNNIKDFQVSGGKPCFIAEKNGKVHSFRGKEEIDNYEKKIDIGGKQLFKIEKNGKYCIIRGDEIICYINNDKGRNLQDILWEQPGYSFDKIREPKDIGGKPCFGARKNGKWCIMWGKEQYSNWYDFVGYPISIGGKPCFIAEKNRKWCIILGNKQYSDGFDNIGDLQEIGGKPYFIAKKNGKDTIMRGTEELANGFNKIHDIKEIGGKPCFIAEKDGKQCVMWGKEQYSDRFNYIYKNIIEILGKPAFIAEKNGKKCVMRGDEQQGDRFENVGVPVEIGGKPCFIASKHGKKCIMRGDEQYSDWFDEIRGIQEILGKPAFIVRKNWKHCVMWGREQKCERGNNECAKNEMQYLINKYENMTQESSDKNDGNNGMTNRFNEEVSTTENQGSTLREKREGVILDRYQKKLNRDELLKIISGIERMDEETKKTLKSEVLCEFYTEFKKIISTNEFKDMDKEYRELKKVERQKAKKSVELEKQKKIDIPEMAELDEKLSEIANSAMELENGSRWNNRRLKKAQSERDKLSERQKKIIKDLEKIKEEKKELELIEVSQTKKYGKKTERPKIKGIELKKYAGSEGELELEKTLKGHKKMYLKIIGEKEKYMNDLLYQIETTDFGISEEKKKDVIEKVKISLEKDLEAFKKGDDILKIAEKTEKWLKENEEIYKEKMEELERKIAEKEKEIQNIEEEDLEGKSVDEILEIKQQKIKLNKELIKIKEEYEKIKSEWEEKLEKYQGKE